ncbi:unnamed protein product [Staurois parvus]|uniref:Uncharacterized protein n=1 Tax=Staurois parvus TaxID=386267 RepID=A0ABN9C1H2_9NEOB|nr:unnamed protein product [Staurois parvus]
MEYLELQITFSSYLAVVTIGGTIQKVTIGYHMMILAFPNLGERMPFFPFNHCSM